MREIFIETLFTCGAILAVTATLAAVRFLGQYAFHRAKREIIMTGNTVTVGSPEPAAPTLIAVPTISAPKPPAEDFTVECGQCKTPILSKPLRAEMAEGGKTRLVYKCEHCGATVGVKA